jgi:hypothetical protein
MKHYDLKTITDGEYKIFPTTIKDKDGYILKRKVKFLFWTRWVPVINQYGVITCLKEDKVFLELIVEQLKVCLTTVSVFELKTHLTKNNIR